MQAHMEDEVGRLQALRQRYADLKKIDSALSSDPRWKSTSLDRHDPIVLEAEACHVYVGIPLTLGTLLAAILADIESVENAIHVLERQLHPEVMLAKEAQRRESAQHLER